MQNKKALENNLTLLRKRAEKTLQGKLTSNLELAELSSQEMHSLIHELQVHQIELEMQNEELRRIQSEIEDSRTKYSDLYDEYSNLYDFAPVGYFTIKEKGIIEQANLTGATLLGLDRQSLIGKPLNRFISREDQDTFYLHHMKALKKNGNHTCEIRMMNYDNAPFYAQLESMAVRGEDKNPTKLRTAIKDITDRKLADEQLQASLKEKEVLLQEIHHRVKNNMQVMISLINLQCETIEDSCICDVFNKTVDRINSMALVHKQLYKSKDFAKVDINKYLISIVENLFVSLGVDTSKISLKIGKYNIALSLDSAISCGLIINELITNSIKHAFPDGRQGQISVEFRFIEDTEIEMMVADDGVGMPVNMNCRNNNTLGLQVVIGLAEHQLGGSLNIDRTNGTKFIIRFHDTPQKGFPQK